MECNAIKRDPHPLYSQDSAPSDLYLSDHAKQLLRGCEFAGREAVLHATADIFRGIDKVILKDVFFSWMERLRQYGSTAGGCVK
jgi:hypothetical protein